MKTSSISKTIIIGAACLAMSSFAQAQITTTVREGPNTTTTTTVEKDHGGAASGAVGGAVAGALVAGPVGLVVGGVAGAAIGKSIAPPSEVKTYVTTQNVDPVQYNGKIVMGKAVDGDMVWREVPSNPKYRWAYLNGQRVVIQRDNGHVVAIY